MAKINNNLQPNYGEYSEKKTKNLSFSKGEVFSGRVVAKGENQGEIILRIGDKWQVKANIKDSSNISEGSHKFKVVGYENNQLQLEVVDEKSQGSGKKESQLDDLAKKFGLSDEDKKLLMEFVKEGVPLTKENITNAKNILHLSDQLNNSDVNIDELVNKFLEGKDIDLSSQKGQELAQSIKDALNNLKGLTKDQILFMLENGLDFSKEGIESLKNLLGKDSAIFNDLKEMLNVSGSMALDDILSKDILGNFDLKLNTLLEKFDLTKFNLANIKNTNDLNPEFLKELTVLLKDSNINIPKNLLHAFGGNEELINSLDAMMKGESIIKGQPIISSAKSIQTETNPVDILKELNINGSKENIQMVELLNNLKGMLSGKDISAITSARLLEAGIDEKSPEGQAFSKDFSNVLKDLNSESVKDIVKELFTKPNELEGNTNFLKGMESDLKSLLSNQDFTLKDLVQPENAIKDTVKVDNAAENEVKNQNTENREKNTIEILKEFKMEISKQNVEIVDTVKAYKEIIQNKDVETIAFKQLQNSGIDPNSKEGQRFLKDLSTFLNDIKSSPLEKLMSNVANMNKDEIKNTLGFLKDIKDSILTKETITASSKAAMIKEDITAKLDLMKEMITTLASKETTSMQFLNMFKGAISDFKVFNELSGNYYMVDVPLKWNEGETGCKLIVKDDRKSGKKIDSTNIKIVATVNTINMGDIDAYIKVNDKNMYLELKTEEQYTGIFERSKDIVRSALSTIGYSPIVSVSKKIVQADIVNTKEFFEENNTIGINTRV